MTADQLDRDIARKRLDVNIVVEAGAGTGKTTLLTDRLLFLLLAGGPRREGLSITNIVALTFTEKAAGEIKIRLADRLGDLVKTGRGVPLPEARARRTQFWIEEAKADFGATDGRILRMAQDALRELDRAPMGTIHGFCKTILQLYPMEAGVNPGFQVDSGPVFEEHFRMEWSRWLEEELTLGSVREPLWREVLEHVTLDDLAVLAKALTLHSPPGHVDSEPTDRVTRLARAVVSLPDGKPVPKRGKIVESIARLGRRLNDIDQAVHDPLGPLPDEDDWKEESKKKWPEEWKDMEGEPLLEEARGLANEVSPLGEKVLARARRLLAPFASRCRTTYRAAGWMGFDDLLRGARDLLAHHPEVRRELKNRFGAVLVDEFQDTDPLQGETLLFLSEGASSQAERWSDVELAPGKLFIVGDPKQSIYRFRGADIRAYEAFVNLVLSQGGQKCDLHTSFRSHARVVDPVNRIFSDLMNERPGLQPAYLPLAPRPGEAGQGEVEIVITPDRQAQARWIAQWIVDHCGPEGSGRGWRLGDVALLFRSTSSIDVYMDALKEARIPYLVESDRAYYGTPEVMDVLNFLRVVDDPGDQTSWVGLLRSPLALLDDRDIMDLAEAKALGQGLKLPAEGPAESRERVERLNGLIDRFRLLARERPLAEWMARLMGDTPLMTVAAKAYQGEQTVSNLLKLVRLAQEYAALGGGTVGGLARRLTERIGRGEEEGESPLGEERTDAVRLLTIHKAKGLEYRVVLLPNLSGGVGNGARHKVAVRRDWASGRTGHRLVKKNWSDAAMVLMEGDEQRRSREEAIRLFYVAATRARDHAILIGEQDAKQGTFMSMLKSVARPTGGGWGFKDGFLLPVTETAPSGPSPVLWAAPQRTRGPLASKDRDDRWKERLEQAGRIQGRPLFRVPSASPENPSPTGVRRGYGSHPGHGALIGQLCHGVLETWAWNDAPVAAAVEKMIARLAPDHPLADWAAVRSETVELLSSFFASTLGRSLGTSEILAREAPFLYRDGDHIVRGVIDLFYRREGSYWVADYKTDLVLPAERPSRAEVYRAQGRDYQTAVENILGVPCGFEVIFLRGSQSFRWAPSPATPRSPGPESSVERGD